MTIFVYKNAKNLNTGNILLDLYYGYYLKMSYKNDVDFYF